MRTRQIEVLQAILRTGSLTAAARLLHVSQPAVTRSLQQAESGLGYPLFLRKGTRLVPTPEAVALAPMVDEVTKSIDSVRKLARNLKLGEHRPVRVAAVPSLAVALLPSGFARARRRLPGMRTELGSAHYDEMLQKLLQHEVDVGLAFDPPPHPFIDSIELGSLQLVAAGLPSALGKYASHASVSPEALSTMKLIELAGRDPLGQIYQRFATLYRWPAARISVQSYHIGLQLAKLGEGVALIDSESAALHGSPLKVLPFNPPIEFPVCALLPKDSTRTAILETVIECMREEIVARSAPSAAAA